MEKVQEMDIKSLVVFLKCPKCGRKERYFTQGEDIVCVMNCGQRFNVQVQITPS